VLTHHRAEVVAARLEPAIGVPVEAGAPWGQQDDVAGESSCPGDVDRLRHRRCRRDRHARCGERRGDVAARLADGDDPADALGRGGHRRQIETLVASTGDEHDVIEAVDRRRCGMRRRRLRVVEPGDAAGVGDELDAMRRPDERGQRRRHRSRVGQPALEHEGGGGKPVGDVVGQAAPHRRDRRDLATRGDQRTVLDPVVGAVAGERDVATRRESEMMHHRGVVGVADRDVARELVGEDASLGGRVGRQRPVPIEMVGGEVEPGRGVGAEALGPGQTEARALDDEGVEIVEADSGDERDVGVAGSDRAHPGGLEHGDSEQRRRRLAVGAGDGEHRPRPAAALLLPLVGELELADDAPSAPSGDGEQPMALRHPGRRDDDVAALHQCVELVVRRFDRQLDPQLGGEPPSCRCGRVVGGDDVDAAAQQRPRRRLAGDGQAVDEHPVHGMTSETRVKSLMKTPRATATETAANSQKRMITVVSGQPISSKW
jgi:hypothetical protein